MRGKVHPTEAICILCLGILLMSSCKTKRVNFTMRYSYQHELLIFLHSLWVSSYRDLFLKAQCVSYLLADSVIFQRSILGRRASRIDWQSRQQTHWCKWQRSCSEAQEGSPYLTPLSQSSNAKLSALTSALMQTALSASEERGKR